jgi:hypothetical protein
MEIFERVHGALIMMYIIRLGLEGAVSQTSRRGQPVLSRSGFTRIHATFHAGKCVYAFDT